MKASTKIIPTPEELENARAYERNQAAAESDRQAEEAAKVPFPIDAFSKTLRDMCEELISVRKVSGDIVGPCALSMISAAAGRGYELRTFADRTVRANIYTILAAPSGAGKGSAVERLIEPLMEEERTMIAEHKLESKELVEALEISKDRYAAFKKQVVKGFKKPEDEA